MVRLIAFLVFAAVLALVAACGGDSAESPAPSSSGQNDRPRATSVPTRQASGPTAAVEPRSGPPGSEITVTGAGWPAGITIDLTGQVPAGVQASPYATVVTDGSGGFVARFRLEKTPDGHDLETGRFDLIARAPGVQVGIPFQVETRRPIRNPGPGG
jgi:hypothetical protein